MKTSLLWISCFSYGLIAFTLVILGAILPELLAHYSQSYSDGGVLVFSQFTGFLIGVLGMPLLVKKLGRKKVVLAGLASAFFICESCRAWSRFSRTLCRNDHSDDY